MKARFVGLPMDDAGVRPSSSFLTVGRDYVVLSITVPATRPVQYRLLTDQGDPSLFDASLFDLASDEVPSNWRVKVGGGGSAGRLEIGPKPWMERGFWEDYTGDDVTAALAAQAIFERESEIILHESE